MGAGSNRRWWWQLITAPRTADPERDLRADLLTALEVVFLALVSVIGLLVLPRWQNPHAPHVTATFHASLFATLAVLGCVIVNRRGESEASAQLFIAVTLGTTLWGSYELPILLVAITVVVLLAIALFPLKGGHRDRRLCRDRGTHRVAGECQRR
ncbi:MAG TPA: hypothetical protein VI197_14340 [Polyangiaceae bacterium]